MTLAPGQRLGPYEIIAPIGSGGMGQVWRARDTRLNRDVAIKTSAAMFSDRFEREARAIAALNHPHICQIYDVGPNYIVMELVDGAPVKGPLPLDQALKLSIQLASALEAAHRSKITHRDLKPANILNTKSGVKVLDFGLAKVEEKKVAGPDDVTFARALTTEGAIVGTLQYMAPEQVQGKEVDSRADIFSFGCVLYEMLTGKRAFDGANAASVIGAVLEREAPSVGDVAPPALDRLVKRCLAKDPDDRYQTARDIRADLEWIAAGGGVGFSPPRDFSPARLPWAIAAVCFIAAAALAFLWLRQPAPQTHSVAFNIEPPPDNQFTNTFGATAISPDGRYLVFGAGTGSATPSLWLRPIGSLDARPLPDTAAGNFPFWSPDGKSLAFLADGKLKRIDIAGGAPLVLCDATSGGGSVGGTWNRDGVILFAGVDGLFRVPASGGVPARLTQTEAAHQETAQSEPQFLPGGKRFLYFIDSANPNTRGIYAASLDHPEEGTGYSPQSTRPSTRHHTAAIPARCCGCGSRR